MMTRPKIAAAYVENLEEHLEQPKVPCRSGQLLHAGVFVGAFVDQSPGAVLHCVRARSALSELVNEE